MNTTEFSPRSRLVAALIDLILIAVGSFRDKQNRRVLMWMDPGSI